MRFFLNLKWESFLLYHLFFFFFFGLIKLIVEKENVCEYLTEYFVIIILARQ
jgi:hypothetical protein